MVADRGQQIVTDFVKKQGGAIDACFGPKPAIKDPGAIRAVSEGGQQSTAVDRLIIAIDASGSMAARSGNETKMDAAKNAAIGFLAGVPASTQIGLVAFGHRGNNLPSGKAESCHGVDNVYALGAANPGQIASALRRVSATGWTPLAAAIKRAGQSFAPSQALGRQVIYVVSDGLETCGGNPVAEAKALNQGPVKAIINIIGFDLSAADRAQLSAVAAAGGGLFVEAKSGGDVGRALDEVRRKARNVSAMTDEYLDAGARTTDNNLAVGKYTTALNYCIARTTSAEMSGVQRALADAKASISEGEAALAMMRKRHDGYRERSSSVAASLSAKVEAANMSIAGQQRRSEIRLGTNPGAR